MPHDYEVDKGSHNWKHKCKNCGDTVYTAPGVAPTETFCSNDPSQEKFNPAEKFNKDMGYDEKVMRDMLCMKIHDSIRLPDGTEIFRVPYGFIYRHWNKSFTTVTQAVFVPEYQIGG